MCGSSNKLASYAVRWQEDKPAQQQRFDPRGNYSHAQLAPKTNALPFEQLAGWETVFWYPRTSLCLVWNVAKCTPSYTIHTCLTAESGQTSAIALASLSKRDPASAIRRAASMTSLVFLRRPGSTWKNVKRISPKLSIQDKFWKQTTGRNLTK